MGSTLGVIAGSLDDCLGSRDRCWAIVLSRNMSSSLAVAFRTRFQVTDWMGAEWSMKAESEVSSGRYALKGGGNRRGEDWSEATSLLSGIFIGSLVGCLDMVSAARCFLPGMCVMLNLYCRVFSFRLRRRGFGMFLRDRSPNSFSKGLWSTAIVRSSHPRTEYST